MRAHQAYKQQQSISLSRIDAVRALYGKALEHLTAARQLLCDRRSEAARPLLARTQLIISCLAAGHIGKSDDASRNFLRLYEFVGHSLHGETIEGIDAARNVLRPLLEGFDAIRDDAVSLEGRGVIPPLDRESEWQITA